MEDERVVLIGHPSAPQQRREKRSWLCTGLSVLLFVVWSSLCVFFGFSFFQTEEERLLPVRDPSAHLPPPPQPDEPSLTAATTQQQQQQQHQHSHDDAPGHDRHGVQGEGGIQEHDHDVEVHHQHYDLVIGIPTEARQHSIERRAACRETWLRWIEDVSSSYSIYYFFFVGQVEHGPMEDAILSEQQQFSDIVVNRQHKDEYKSLAQKTQLLFDYVGGHYNFTYFLKCDDDSFVVLSRLMIALDSQPTEKLYFGKELRGANAPTGGKWKDLEYPQWMGHGKYAPFMFGCGYVLSRDLVNYLGNPAVPWHYLVGEDISTGLWLSPLEISRVSTDHFDNGFRQCKKGYILNHYVKPDQMRIRFRNHNLGLWQCT